MRLLAQDDRDSIRREMFEILCKPRHRITALAAVCSAKAAYQIPRITSQEDIYHFTCKPVTERFQYFLQDVSTKARTEFGIIICDHRGGNDDTRLRRHHQMLVHAAGGYTSDYKNLVESVFLQPSHQSIGIQLADILAGAVWRMFERSDDRFYKMAESAFRRDRRGRIPGYGLIKTPKTGWI
jgi:hypothetical protein